MIERTLSPRGTNFELYDLTEDPAETVNRAGEPELAQIENELRRRLREWMYRTADPLLSGPVASPFYRTTRSLLET